MGAGDDTFVWNPGDGSDTVEGQAGIDTMLFNGANVNEKIDISANGQRVRFTRDVGNIMMDLNGVEGIDFNALGGADTITVNDLTGTDVTQLNLDLASPPGSGTGDGQADTVIVNGTNGDDAVTVAGDASGVAVLGLAAQVNITGAEAANDRLTVNALGGDDVVDASGLSAGAIALTADGGDGDDVLIGGDGNDTLIGGDGRRRPDRRAGPGRPRRRPRQQHPDRLTETTTVESTIPAARVPTRAAASLSAASASSSVGRHRMVVAELAGVPNAESTELRRVPLHRFTSQDPSETPPLRIVASS